MIPTMNIVAWSRVAPWAEQRQVEQDLIICRAIVELFGDSFLRGQLRFRGGRLGPEQAALLSSDPLLGGSRSRQDGRRSDQATPPGDPQLARAMARRGRL